MHDFKKQDFSERPIQRCEQEDIPEWENSGL